MNPDDQNYLYRRKRAMPFGRPRTPFDPFTGEHLGFDEPRRDQRAQIVSEGDNTLVVKFYDESGELLQEEVTASKLIGTRRQDYEGETYDDATYAYASANTRTATDEDGNESTHTIIPSYREGLDVLLARPVGGSGVVDEDTGEMIEWLDVTPGRWWLES